MTAPFNTLAAAAHDLPLITTIAAAFTAAWVFGLITQRLRLSPIVGYLVTGLGHCGACHTPKNYFGADRDAQALAGNEVGGWFAPRLDGAARTGLKSWSEADITEYLQSGRNARSHADGPMAEVIVNSTSKMSDADVSAIALYLKSLPPARRETIVTPPDDAEMKAGQAIYAKLCIA